MTTNELRSELNELKIKLQDAIDKEDYLVAQEILIDIEVRHSAIRFQDMLENLKRGAG